ncbi:MAG: hypothetical protein ACXVZU_04635, partial [Methanobacteriaceae archaeon]
INFLSSFYPFPSVFPLQVLIMHQIPHPLISLVKILPNQPDLCLEVQVWVLLVLRQTYLVLKQITINNFFSNLYWKILLDILFKHVFG